MRVETASRARCPGAKRSKSSQKEGVRSVPSAAKKRELVTSGWGMGTTACLESAQEKVERVETQLFGQVLL